MVATKHGKMHISGVARRGRRVSRPLVRPLLEDILSFKMRLESSKSDKNWQSYSQNVTKRSKFQKRPTKTNFFANFFTFDTSVRCFLSQNGRQRSPVSSFILTLRSGASGDDKSRVDSVLMVPAG